MVELKSYNVLLSMNTRFLQFITLFLLALWAISASALSLFGKDKEQPLLEASEAFATQVTLEQSTSPDPSVAVQIDIAPGYFLYRSKISVESSDAQFGALQLPAGEKKQDQFFGDVETYRDTLNFTAPLTSVKQAGVLSVTVNSQGCADIGICYPPHSEVFTLNIANAIGTQTLNDSASNALTQDYKADGLQDPVSNTFSNNLSLPKNNSPAMSSAAISSSAEPTTSLSSILSIDSGNEVLDPEVAFTLEASTINNGIAPIRWNISEDHYLYKKRFSFELLAPNGATLGDAKMPEGSWEEDAFFGKSEVFRNAASVELPIVLPANTKEAILKVGYQGCADIGICYPPIYKEVKLVEITAVASASAINTAAGNTAASATIAPSANITNTTDVIQPEQDRLADSLKGSNRWLTILTFFGMGLLLTFTPCVLPMVPILSSIIIGSGEKIGAPRAFYLSLVYVLAMALTYTIAGVLIGLSGENIQATLQHPVVLTAFALLFVVLSLSMFGLFELQMPQFLQSRLTNISNKQKSGSFAGVATMGFLSALIVGPCVTAPLVGALIYIGQTGDAVLGGAALFALSMGMGVPILIIGTTFGKYIPKAGPWMDTTKAIFGVLLLGLAIYMLDRIIPTWATMLLSALLLIVVGLFMGAFESYPSGIPAWKRITKGLGYASVVYGTLLMIGAASGTGSLLRPMQGFHFSGEKQDTSAHVTFQKVKGLEQLNVALADAKSSNRPVIFDFYADWCISCKEMEAFTFTDQAVASKMNQALLLQADVTANDEQDKQLLKEFGIFGPPAIIFYNANGIEDKSARVVGYMPADKFITVLDRVF